MWQRIIWNQEPGGNVEYTPDGTYIIAVYDLLDADTIYPVTAYAIPEP